MGLYEDKLHEFLSQPENFDYGWEIFEAMPILRDKLRVEALDEFEKLATPLAQKAQWVCWRMDSERVGITKPAWNRLFAMRLSMSKEHRPSLGLWHDKDHESLKGQYDELVTRTREAARECKIKNNGTQSLWYLRLGTNYETAAEMKELLPANRQELLLRYWEQLWQIATKFEASVDDIVRNLKTGSK